MGRKMSPRPELWPVSLRCRRTLLVFVVIHVLNHLVSVLSSAITIESAGRPGLSGDSKHSIDNRTTGISTPVQQATSSNTPSIHPSSYPTEASLKLAARDQDNGIEPNQQQQQQQARQAGNLFHIGDAIVSRRSDHTGGTVNGRRAPAWPLQSSYQLNALQHGRPSGGPSLAGRIIDLTGGSSAAPLAATGYQFRGTGGRPAGWRRVGDQLEGAPVGGGRAEAPSLQQLRPVGSAAPLGQAAGTGGAVPLSSVGQQAAAVVGVQELAPSDGGRPNEQQHLAEKLAQEQRKQATDLSVSQTRGRSVRNAVAYARNLLTGSFASIEQRAGTILSYGSSLLAALIPLASLLLSPARNGDHTPMSHQQPSATGLQVADSTTSPLLNSVDQLPAAQSGPSGNGPKNNGTQNTRRSSSNPMGLVGLQMGVEHVMGWLERSMEHLPSFPRLHPQECLKRSICEAHNDPDRHGGLGLMVRLLFPAGGLAHEEQPSGRQGATANDSTTLEYKVINKYRHAAGFGLSRRLDNNGTGSPNVCKDKYEDCLVSLLDLANGLVGMFFTR